MNNTENDANIPEELCIKKEHHDLTEECGDNSASADDACEYKFSPLLLPSPKQESGDGSIPHSLSKASVCKGTNVNVYLDGQIKREDVEYNANCDTTGMHQLTSQLHPIEQVFVEDHPHNEGEGTSTCKKLKTGISREEDPGSDDDQKNLKLEDDDYLSENCLEIKEEVPSYNADSDDICDKQSPYLWPPPEGKGDPVEHQLTKNKDKPYTCDVCNKDFSEKSKFLQHKRIHTEEKSFTCDVCNKAFPRKSKVVEHMRIHTGEKPFTCDICNRGFSHSSSLRKHRRIHTKEKPFSCDVCGKAFTQKPHLVEHMIIHTKEWPFTCDVCSKSFSRKKTLVEHMRLHVKESPFTCDVCNNCFTRKATLLDHMRVHTKEKPFACDICNNTFARKTTLVEHMRVHSNEKPYTCDVCTKAFARMSNLRQHMRIHTEERPLTYDTIN